MKMCIRNRIINIDGKPSTSIADPAAPIKCCLAGSKQNDLELQKACEFVTSVSHRVTYDWFDSMQGCSESTVVTIDGIENDPDTVGVDSSLCCAAA